MEINWKENMNEIGGAFALSWMVFGMGNVEFAIAMAIAWMAFTGAHLLPVVTWCHMMTSDLSDVEGNWMANGIRLVSQVIGACLAIVIVTEGGAIGDVYDAAELWIYNGTSKVQLCWIVMSWIAAGAIWWQIHTRCNSPWASGIGLMILMSLMPLEGAHNMGSSITSLGDGIVNTLVNWISHGLLVGAGALLGVKIDEMLDNMDSGSSEEEAAAAAE